MIFCAHTQEGEGLIVPGTERHARLFEVKTRMYVRTHEAIRCALNMEILDLLNEESVSGARSSRASL